jgi:hypothetical protein
MKTRSICFDPASEIQGDHERLGGRLRWIHQQLSSAGLSPTQTDRELLRTEAELEQHFAKEEAGGFFAQILELSPEFTDQVRCLLKQHQEMRLLFRSLRETSRWACGESGSRAGWLAEFAAFHSCFDAHERREHELFYEALQRDVGATD